MFFLILIVLMVWFQAKSPVNMPQSELWVILSIFVGLAYVFGFLDSRLFARLDRKNANQLAETEARYDEQHFQQQPFQADSISIN